MNGQTICQYGTVKLFRCTIHKIEQRPVFDSSGTDLKCWKFTVNLTGYLQSSILQIGPGQQYSGPDQRVTVGSTQLYGSAAVAHRQIRWRMTPRQRFWLATGCDQTIEKGSTLLFADPFTDYGTDLTTIKEPRTNYPNNGVSGLSLMDVNDGPRCLQFDVVHVASDNVFRMQATFEIHRVQCQDDDTTLNNTGVLCNRWSVGDSLDHNLQTTRTYRGILEVASAQFSPHWFRSLVVPPLQPGFRRDLMEFTAAEDGKKLLYAIVDREIHLAAPPPARRWNVQYTEHITAASGGMMSSGSIAVTLEGSTDTDRMQLFMLGIWIISAKMLGLHPSDTQKKSASLTDLTMTEFIGDSNVVQLTASCRRLPDATANQVTPYLEGFQHTMELNDFPAWVKQYDTKLSLGAYPPNTVVYQVPNGVDSSGNTKYQDGPSETTVYEGLAKLAGIFRCYLNSACDSVFGTNNSNVLSKDLNDSPSAPPAPPTTRAVVVSKIDDENDPTQPDIDFLSESTKTAIYTHYQCDGKFVTTQMRAAMPIASAPATGGGVDVSDAAAIVSLARPQARYVLTIHGERVGTWPEFPDPGSVGKNSPGDPIGYATMPGGIAQIGMVLLSSKILGQTVSKTANGENFYRAMCRCVFALKRAPTSTEILKIGHNPWSTDNGLNGTLSTEALTNSAWK